MPLTFLYKRKIIGSMVIKDVNVIFVKTLIDVRASEGMCVVNVQRCVCERVREWCVWQCGRCVCVCVDLSCVRVCVCVLCFCLCHESMSPPSSLTPSQKKSEGNRVHACVSLRSLRGRHERVGVLGVGSVLLSHGLVLAHGIGRVNFRSVRERVAPIQW